MFSRVTSAGLRSGPCICKGCPDRDVFETQVSMAMSHGCTMTGHTVKQGTFAWVSAISLQDCYHSHCGPNVTHCQTLGHTGVETAPHSPSAVTGMLLLHPLSPRR